MQIAPEKYVRAYILQPLKWSGGRMFEHKANALSPFSFPCAAKVAFVGLQVFCFVPVLL